MLSTNGTDKFLLNSGMLEDAQILLVDNDRDTRDLYAFLLEDHGAKVTVSESIRGALDFLDGLIPNLLICEMRFLGESVMPLIQRVRSLALISGRPIPILFTSTASPLSVTQQLTANVEAYLLKPIDINELIEQVWHLMCLSNQTTAIPMRRWEEIEGFAPNLFPFLIRVAKSILSTYLVVHQRNFAWFG